MPEELLSTPLFILLLGTVMVSTMLIKAGLERVGLPALIGHLLLGLGIRCASDAWELLEESGRWSFEMLGELGVICILFRVGLDSDPRQLIKQLPRALSIWVGNVGLSALLGFSATRYVLGLELIPSLFMATALSATSVGVTVLVWGELGVLRLSLANN